MKISTFATSGMSQNFLPACLSISFVSFLPAEEESGKFSNFGIIENVTLTNSSAPLLVEVPPALEREPAIAPKEVPSLPSPEEVFAQAAPPAVLPNLPVIRQELVQPLPLSEEVFAQAAPPSTVPVAPPQQYVPSAQPVQPVAPSQAVPQAQQQFQNPAAPVVPSNPPAIGSPASKYAFHSYRLSYMQSDRVLALLKALGYSTVEFSVGEVSRERYLYRIQKAFSVILWSSNSRCRQNKSYATGWRKRPGTDQLRRTYLHQSTTGT